MRAMLDFPDTYGTDQNSMISPAAAAARRHVDPDEPKDSLAEPILLSLVTSDGTSDRKSGGPASTCAHVPGPFRESSRTTRETERLQLTAAHRLASGGFRPNVMGEAETDPAEIGVGPIWRDPRTAVIMMLAIGILLAAFSYFMDLR